MGSTTPPACASSHRRCTPAGSRRARTSACAPMHSIRSGSRWTGCASSTTLETPETAERRQRAADRAVVTLDGDAGQDLVVEYDRDHRRVRASECPVVGAAALPEPPAGGING